MNELKLKRNRIFLYMLIFGLLVSNSIFASNILVTGNSRQIFEGPVGNDLIVTGDSYAQHFALDEKGKDYQIYSYANENTTIEENMQTINKAFDSFGKIILFSISVNDQIKGIHPTIFEESLRKILDKGVANNKIVFMHTYMQYPREYYYGGIFSSYDYDNVIRKLANEYSNVYYIDMSDYGDLKYTVGDQVHYSKDFNDILYNRLKAKITEILN